MNPLDAYMKNSVQTASPLQQVILLYERAIVAMKAAKEDIENKNIPSKVSNITKASDIIRALDSSLDFEKGGDIAKNLHSIYDFLSYSLIQVNLKNDTQLLNDLIEIMENLKEGWEGIQSKV